MMHDLFMLMTSDPSLYLHAGENLLIMESTQVIENHLQSATDLSRFKNLPVARVLEKPKHGTRGIRKMFLVLTLCRCVHK